MHVPVTLFSSCLLHPHLHEGDAIEKRADSGGFKLHLLGNETIDGAKEGAEKSRNDREKRASENKQLGKRNEREVHVFGSMQYGNM